MDSEKKKALSKKLEGYIIEIDKTLRKCNENNYITERDTAMLRRKLSYIYKELYGQHEEFVEVDMTLKKLVEASWDDTWDKAIAKNEKKCTKQNMSRVAKAMKVGGEAIDKIMRYTGLSRREIMAL